MFLEAKNQHRFISRTEVMALSVAALLLHGTLLWLLLHPPGIRSAEIPPMIAAKGEQSVMVDLTDTASASQAQESPPQPTPDPIPIEPEEPERVHVDEDAVTPPEPEQRVVSKPPVAKPTPVVKTKPIPRAVTKAAAPASTNNSSAPTDTQGETATGSNQAKGNPQGSRGGESVTPAVSGMQSLGNPAPDYPTLALRRRQEGSVTLRILVLENGKAGEVQVTASSQSTLLDNAAVQTVQQWRFIPAKRGNVAIKGYAIQTITFRLPK